VSVDPTFFDLSSFSFPVVSGVTPPVPPVPPVPGSVSLRHSPAEIVRQLLVNALIASDPGDGSSRPTYAWPGYATNEPSTPDNTITVYDTTGQSDGRTMPDGEAVSHYGVQVRVRSRVHSQGWQMADSIRERLTRGVYGSPVRVDSTDYLVYNFARVGNVIPVGKDAPNTRRSLFTLNAIVALKMVVTP